MKLSNVPWTLQEEYQGEGISWHNIDYTDNVGCIHLISKKPTGLFYLLDEESKWVSTAHCMCQPRRSVFFLAPYPESRPSLGASEFLRLIWPQLLTSQFAKCTYHSDSLLVLAPLLHRMQGRLEGLFLRCLSLDHPAATSKIHLLNYCPAAAVINDHKASSFKQ